MSNFEGTFVDAEWLAAHPSPTAAETLAACLDLAEKLPKYPRDTGLTFHGIPVLEDPRVSSDLYPLGLWIDTRAFRTPPPPMPLMLSGRYPSRP